MKKLLSILLALSLVFALFAGFAGNVSADDYYGDRYSAFDNGNGTCTISYYSGSSNSTEIVVPNYARRQHLLLSENKIESRVIHSSTRHFSASTDPLPKICLIK